MMYVVCRNCKYICYNVSGYGCPNCGSLNSRWANRAESRYYANKQDIKDGHQNFLSDEVFDKDIEE
jgi:hypothetical protein